jgi:hypothetical protein
VRPTRRRSAEAAEDARRASGAQPGESTAQAGVLSWQRRTGSRERGHRRPPADLGRLAGRACSAGSRG